MDIQISPMQLFIYLQFAIRYAKKELNADLQLAKEISKKLQQVNWDKDAMLFIDELPF